MSREEVYRRAWQLLQTRLDSMVPWKTLQCHVCRCVSVDGVHMNEIKAAMAACLEAAVDEAP